MKQIVFSICQLILYVSAIYGCVECHRIDKEAELKELIELNKPLKGRGDV